MFIANSDIVQRNSDSLNTLSVELKGLSLQIAKMEDSNPMKIQDKVNKIVGRMPFIISRIEMIVNMAFLDRLTET